MARRKNATFTRKKTYGSGHGDRTLLKAFYNDLNEDFPGKTPVPIPPESRVHPKHDAETQLFIFADYVVRKIAPIAFQKAQSPLDVLAAQLTALQPVTDVETAAYAASEAYSAADAARATAYGFNSESMRYFHWPPDEYLEAFAKAARDLRYAGGHHWLDTDPSISRTEAYGAAVSAAASADRVAGYAATGDAYRPMPGSALDFTTNVVWVIKAVAKLYPDATWAVVNEMLQAL